MKNKFGKQFFFGLLCGLVYVLGSCSEDNELIGSGDLSIGMQIPMTRSADPEAPQEFLTVEQKKKNSERRLFMMMSVACLHLLRSKNVMKMSLLTETRITRQRDIMSV